MINASSSIAGSILPTLGLTGGSLITSADGSSSSDFGADFLLSTMGGGVNSGAASTGTIYDAKGNLVSQNGVDTKVRTAALTNAKALLDAGDTVGARDAANSILKIDSTDAVAAAYVGRTYLQEGKYNDAAKYFARAASNSDDVQIQNDLHAAQTLAKGDGATIDEVNKLLRQSSTSRQGAQLATYLLAVEPGNLDARTSLVNFYESLGKTNLAGAELADALPDVPDSRLNEFVSQVEKFNSNHPQDASSWDLLAQTYVKAGRLTDAQAAFDKALSLSGDNVEFQTQIKQSNADTYLKLAKEQRASGDADGAIRTLQQGLDIFSTEDSKAELSDISLERGQTALRQGRLKQALDDLNTAQAYLPGTADDAKKNDLIQSFESLATKFAAAGDLKSVTSARYGAFIVDPSNDTRKRSLADAYDVYGQDLASKGDYQTAIRQYRQALNYYKNDTNYAAHLNDAQGHL